MPTREYYEKHKEEIKLKRKLYYQEQKRAKELTEEISKKYALPYSLQSFKNFRETMPFAKWSDYIDALNKFREIKRNEESDMIYGMPLEFDVAHYPLNKRMWRDCLKFRTMILNLQPKLFPRDTIFLSEHSMKCLSCNQWHRSLKSSLECFKPLPFDLFHGHEHVEPKQEPKSELERINEWLKQLNEKRD
jgi:hypothetical protein